jgi:hypothetical protein
VIVGAAGAVVSTVNACVVAGLALLAASAAVTLTLWPPVVSGVVGLQLQAPDALATSVQTVTPSTCTVTVVPGSLVPAKVGVVSLTDDALVIVGALGAPVSIVNAWVAAGLVLFAASLTVALTAWLPALNTVTDVHVQLPAPFAVVVQYSTPSTLNFTVPFGSAVPANTGVVSLVIAGLLMVGESGCVVSIVSACGVGELALLAGSVAIALTA